MFSSPSHLNSSAHGYDGDSRRVSFNTSSTPYGSGMTSSSALHGHVGTPWPSTSGANPMSSSLNEPFGQRTTYQQGFIMSTSQNSSAPSTSPRFEEQPVVKTKAKINTSLARASTLEFGKDPMFESSVRQGLDEDAPPTTSVNDIVNGNFAEVSSVRKSNAFEQSLFNSSRSLISATSPSGPLYVIVFGYPPDKYSVAVEYFRQLGDSTEPEPSSEIINAFRVGYRRPADAMRAIRKNGEVVGGSWMIGAKWENTSVAEHVIGQSGGRNSVQLDYAAPMSVSPSADGMAVDRPASGYVSLSTSSSAASAPVPAFGTPLRLAPSASAFRKPGTLVPKPATPHPGTATAPAQPATPSKGVLGQFSDLVFGW